MAKTLTDLREKIFQAIDDVQTGDMAPDRAEAICKLAGVLMESAEVELKAIVSLGVAETGSQFLELIALPAPEDASP